MSARAFYDYCNGFCEEIVVDVFNMNSHQKLSDTYME